MAIYHLKEKEITPVNNTTFQENGILERQGLQAILRDNFDVISEDVLIISEEFSNWEDSRRRIDLLGIDRDANIVVVELKRTDTGNEMELQALRYASMISTMTFENCIEIYQKYLDKREIKGDAKKNLLEFLRKENEIEDGFDEEDFASDVKIILISKDFSPELTSSVLWLNKKGIDITCIKLNPHKFQNEILIDITQVIPLPEAKELMIKIRKQEFEREQAREKKSKKDTTKYKFNNTIYRKNALVFEFVRQFVADNPHLTFTELKNVIPDELQGSSGVIHKLEDAREKTNKSTDKRWRFSSEEQFLTSVDSVQFVISNQWGIGNINNVINIAKEKGYEIEEV